MSSISVSARPTRRKPVELAAGIALCGLGLLADPSCGGRSALEPGPEPTFAAAGATNLPVGGATSRATGGSSPCQPNPCVHGTCAQGPGDFTCSCDAGFAGSRCNLRALEVLDPPSDWCSALDLTPTDISDDGRVVIGMCKAQVALRWSEESGFESFMWPLSVTRTNRDGSVVLGYTDNTDSQALRIDWLSKQKKVLPSKGSAFASAISGDNRIIVGTDQSVACRWVDDADPEQIGWLASDSASSGAANTDLAGSVVVGQSGNSAYAWSAATGIRDLGRLDGTEYASARSVSGDGTIVVGVSFTPWYPPRKKAFLWSVSGMMELQCAAGFVGAHAADISVDGSTVAVNCLISFATPHQHGAAIWQAGVGTRLVSDILTEQGVELQGLALESVQSVSGDGKVLVGQGNDEAGRRHAWIARLR